MNVLKGDWSVEEFRKAQREDVPLGSLCSHLENDADIHTGCQQKEVRMLLKENLILSVQGVLLSIPSDGIGLPQTVVPVKLVPEVLDLRMTSHCLGTKDRRKHSFTPILAANS